MEADWIVIANSNILISNSININLCAASDQYISRCVKNVFIINLEEDDFVSMLFKCDIKCYSRCFFCLKIH